jgi:hypothetical protein
VLRSEKGRVVLELTGGKPQLQTEVALTEENIGALLKDPEVFLTGPDNHEIERLIGFQLAWKLIEEMEGRLEARLREGKLAMTASFPQAGEKKEPR